MSENPDSGRYKTKAESGFFMGSYVHLKVPDGEEKWEELPERDHQSHSQTGTLWFKTNTTSGQENVRIRINPYTSKPIKKNLDFYCFVISKWRFILKMRIRIHQQAKLLRKNHNFYCFVT